MRNLHLKNWLNSIFIYLLTATPVFASTTSSLPFTSTLKTLKDGISGPFLMSASIILIVVTCLMLAFGEWGDGFKKIINIVLWLSVAFGVTSFISTLFATGAVI